MKDNTPKLHSIVIILFFVFLGLFGFIFITNCAKAQSNNSIIDNADIEYGLQTESIETATSDDGHGLGLNQNGMIKVEPGDKNNNLKLRKNLNNDIPTSYDLRNVNNQSYVTDVRNQGIYGTCWAFASLGSAESNLLKSYGTANLKIFSPYHLAYFNYYYNANFGDPLSNLNKLFRGTYGAGNKIEDNHYNYLSIGGNEQMATFTLANGKGFADENNYKYEEAKPASNIDSSHAYENCGYSLENSIWVSPEETKTIKEDIIKYGAASTGIYYSKDYLNDNSAYYYGGSSVPNHSVDIIGWDDNFSKENFKSDNKPNGNGAWLVKNSYGPNWGDNGYFWLSYEDSSFKSNFNAAYFFTVKQNSNSEKTYQYDGCAGYANLTTDTNVSAANVFYSDDNKQKLNSVSFAVFKPNTNVSINVYTNLKDKSNPKSGILANNVPITETYENEGYYTLNLQNAISIDANTWFAVTIEQNYNDNNTTKYMTPIVKDENLNDVLHYITNSQPGESYIFDDNDNIQDFSNIDVLKNSNLILKAHTVDVKTYSINVESEGPGKVDPSSIIYAQEAEDKTFNFTPDTDCYIDKIIIDNNELQDKPNSYTFQNVQEDHSIKVIFKHNPYTITATASEGGNISPNGQINVDYMSSQGFIITADQGFSINDVIIDGISKGKINFYSFDKIQANHSISVSFVKEKYNIKATAKEGGSISPNNTNVDCASDVTFKITPDSIHNIKKLMLDNSIDVTNEINSNNEYILKNVQKSHTVQVEFELKPNKDIKQGIYKITSAINANFSLDINASSSQNCANVQLYESNDTLAQRFYIKKIGNYYSITAMCSDKALDVQGAKTTNYTNLQQYSSNNSAAQLWTIIDQGDGKVTFVSKCSNKCINVAAAKAENLNNLWLYNCDGTNAENFYMQLDEDPIGFGSSAYMFQSALSDNKVLDIQSGSKDDLANVQIYDKNYTLAQKFHVTYKGAGIYKITSLCSNKVLDVAGASNENYTNVHQYEFNRSSAQFWRISNINNKLKLSPMCAPDKCLDLNAANTENGSNIQIYKDNNINAQRFIAVEVEN